MKHEFFFMNKTKFETNNLFSFYNNWQSKKNAKYEKKLWKKIFNIKIIIKQFFFIIYIKKNYFWN